MCSSPRDIDAPPFISCVYNMSCGCSSAPTCSGRASQSTIAVCARVRDSFPCQTQGRTPQRRHPMRLIRADVSYASPVSDAGRSAKPRSMRDIAPAPPHCSTPQPCSRSRAQLTYRGGLMRMHRVRRSLRISHGVDSSCSHARHHADRAGVAHCLPADAPTGDAPGPASSERDRAALAAQSRQVEEEDDELMASFIMPQVGEQGG